MLLLRCRSIPSLFPMNAPSDNRPSFPIVPSSFLALLLLGAVIWWVFDPGGSEERPQPPTGIMGAGVLESIRTPGGALTTNGIRKTEEFVKKKDTWIGTTTSGIRLDAIYRYEIELRADWKFYTERERGLIFVVAPKFQPQLPVAVDSKTVHESSSSGWGRFDKWDNLRELREEVSPLLARKASSKGYMDLARGPARQTVEEFVLDWTLDEADWPDGLEPVIKVYFEDEPDIPFPGGLTLPDFLP